MDVLESWLDRYNERARPAIPLDSGGEAGGAQLRLKYAPDEDTVSILHLVAASRGGRPVILVSRFEGPTAETSVRSEEHTSELQSRSDLVCRLLLEKKKKSTPTHLSRHRSASQAPESEHLH